MKSDVKNWVSLTSALFEFIYCSACALYFGNVVKTNRQTVMI